jgi:hypothetical protein
MPTIPVYDGPQVKEAPLRGGFQETINDPAAFGATQARQLGEVANTAAKVFQVVEAENARNDADAVFRAETNLRAGYLQYEAHVKKTRQGRSAEGVLEDTDKWWAEQEKAFTEGLANDRQRALLARTASRLKLQSQAQMTDFQNVQLEKSHDESWAASKAIVISNAAANPTPANVQGALAEIKTKNAYQGARKGWDADQMTVQNMKDMTILHTSVVQQMADKDPAAAEKYLAAIPNDEFDGARRDALKDGIERSRVHLEAKRRQAVSQGEADAEKRVWAAIAQGKQPREIDLNAMNQEKRVKEVGGYFKQLAKAEAKDGRMHAREDNYEALDQAEKAIQQGDIQSERDLDRYAPFLRPETFRTLRKSFEKRGEVKESEIERAFNERMGETRAKWIKNEDKVKQWTAFKGYILDNVRETKRPEDVDSWADKWFSKGYGKEDSVFSNDPDTYGEARVKGRKDFVIPTPEMNKKDVAGALTILKSAGASIPTGKTAQDEFYTNYYMDATRWFGARNEPVSGARAAAYAILKQNNKPITPANINAVLEQLKGAPSAGPQQPSR